MKWIVVITAALASLACGGDPVTPVERFELVNIPDFNSKLWTGDLSVDDPVIAEVSGTPITLSMLKTQLKRTGGKVDPRVVLDQMIEFELLARRAFETGKYDKVRIGDAVRDALARHFLLATFEQELSPADIPDRVINRMYKQFRARFDHFERFMVADVQIFCCMDLNDPDNCYRDSLDYVPERRERLRSCIDDHTLALNTLYKRLSAPDAVRDLASFESVFAGIKGDYPGPALRATYHPFVGMQKYDFQYDIDRTYEQQFEKDVVRYRQILKEVAVTIVRAYKEAGDKVPFVTRPIRTAIGWHISYVYEVHPEKHLTVNDPTVQKELREAAFSGWRRDIRYFEVVGDLCKLADCGEDFCRRFARHIRCVETVQASASHPNQDLMRKRCDPFLVVDLKSESGQCELREARIVPLQKLNDSE